MNLAELSVATAQHLQRRGGRSGIFRTSRLVIHANHSSRLFKSLISVIRAHVFHHRDAVQGVRVMPEHFSGGGPAINS